MPRKPLRLATCLAASLALLAPALITAEPAHAAAKRVRLGNSADVSRGSWSGPAYTMNGSGAVVPATMGKAIDAIRGGTGTLDVVVLAGSAPTSGSATPECDAVMPLAGVNSCTTWTLTSRADGNNSAANTDIRNAEFVYFAGGDQCDYADWKGTSLQSSVKSVVARAAAQAAAARVTTSTARSCTTPAAAASPPTRRSTTPTIRR
ncbi:hypothetical protein [Streptomyces arboris]|uniref:hypothetical protein n=1 Tax=Streptomyces arboris TaxID=2600619 RepID=UPI00178C55CE|nr:hypothetical protein [Streptomyces arboris]